MTVQLPFEDRIVRDLASHFGGVTVTLDGPISIRDYSQIYRAAVHANPAIRLAVKRCLMPRTMTPDAATALDQHAALERISGAMGPFAPRFIVPKAAFINQDMATFAMSWVGGKPLTTMLRHPRAFLFGTTWFSDVGAWLGHFHTAGPISTELFDCEARHQNILELQASPVAGGTYQQAVALAALHLKEMSDLHVHTSWLHGDCKTDNFMLDGQTICAIDVSLKYKNAVEYDLAQFLNHLDLQLLSPQNIHLRGLRSALARAFLRGYQSTGQQISWECLEWVRLWAALLLWKSTVHARRPSIKSWVLHRVFASLVRSRCKALIELKSQGSIRRQLR